MSERALIELLFGKGAYANPLACVEDVASDLSGRRTDNFPHTIWQLVSHMNYWTGYELMRIRGEKPVYPAHAAESWPAQSAPANEAEWMHEIERFATLLSELAVLAESTPGQLAHEIDATHPDHAKHSSTLEAVLWQTLVHNSYHVGQIAMLRRALGAWPPRGGGDSW
jgi:uncharacterized damage-inducible protein DinB